jgi:hypothetical protein
MRSLDRPSWGCREKGWLGLQWKQRDQGDWILGSKKKGGRGEPGEAGALRSRSLRDRGKGDKPQPHPGKQIAVEGLLVGECHDLICLLKPFCLRCGEMPHSLLPLYVASVCSESHICHAEVHLMNTAVCLLVP